MIQNPIDINETNASVIDGLYMKINTFYQRPIRYNEDLYALYATETL